MEEMDLAVETIDDGEDENNVQLVEKDDEVDDAGIPSTWQRSASPKHRWLAPAIPSGDRSSPAWEHFDFFQARNGTKNEDFVRNVVRCKFPRCQKELAYNGSSTHGMLGHLEAFHKNEISNKEKEAKKRKLAVARSANGDSGQTSLIAFAGRSEIRKMSNKTKAALDDCVLRFTVLNMLPLATTQKESFRAMFRPFNTDYEPPSRERLSERLIEDKITEMKGKRSKFLEHVKELSIAVDEWSAPSLGRCFLAVTGHGWSSTFERFQMTLGFQPLHEKHDADNINGAIDIILNDCALKKQQVACFMADGAAVMIRAAKDRGLPHLHCLAHVVNLIVEAVFKSSDEMKLAVDIVKHNARIIGRSSRAGDLLTAMQKELNLRPSRLVKECPTRWNGNLLMLRSAYANAVATNALAKKHPDIPLKIIKDVDRALIKELVDFLKNFEDITKISSTTKETASSYIPVVIALRSALLQCLKDVTTSRTVCVMAQAALSQIAVRLFGENSSTSGGGSEWSGTARGNYKDIRQNDFLRKASFLDPRYCFSTQLLPTPTWKVVQMEVEDEGRMLIMSASESQSSAEVSNDAPLLAAAGSVPELNALDDSGDLTKQLSGTLDFLRQITEDSSCALSSLPESDFEGSEATQIIQTEMKTYLSRVRNFRAVIKNPTVDEVSTFWKANHSLLPNFHLLSERYLSGTLGSVDVERAFSSVTSLLADKNRQQLEDSRIVQLLMLRDYFRRENTLFSCDSDAYEQEI